MVQNCGISSTDCDTELNFLVSQLTPQDKALPAVNHAIKTHMSLATGNYHQFFALYLVAPNMGGYIMDHYVDRERCVALTTMTKASVVVFALIAIC